MNLTSRTRISIAALLVLVGLAAGVSQAQTVVSVNGAACAAATVTLGAGTININTGACTAPPTVVAPTISLVSPASGKAGSVVTVSGTGLTGATITIGGIAATITTSSATSITALVPASAPVAAGSLVVTTSAGTATAAFTVEAAGGGDSSIDGVGLPAISKQPFVIPTHTGFNGAGSQVNAYAMDPARCNTTPALSRSWQHNIDLADFRGRTAREVFAMQGSDALSYKFTVPMTDAAGGFTYQENVASGANTAPAFITVTATPCDFDASKQYPGLPLIENSCYQTSIAGVSVNWANIDGALAASYCRLTRGQTYYVNIRFQDARPASQGGSPTSTSCPSGLCGGGLAFN